MSCFTGFKRVLLPIVLALLAPLAFADNAAKTAVEVWKDPNCGCCVDWIAHMEDSGFTLITHETGNAAKRAELGLPQHLGSCHTAVVEGYVIEGHVPAADIRKLLQDRPDALGLAVPGMPLGSPGMDGPQYQGLKHEYDVLLVTKNLINTDEVSTQVFNHYP